MTPRRNVFRRALLAPGLVACAEEEARYEARGNVLPLRPVMGAAAAVRGEVALASPLPDAGLSVLLNHARPPR